MAVSIYRYKATLTVFHMGGDRVIKFTSGDYDKIMQRFAKIMEEERKRDKADCVYTEFNLDVKLEVK